MYYEEKIIDDVFHFRISPDDDFIPVSREVMTRRILMYRKKIEEMKQSAASKLDECADYNRSLNPAILSGMKLISLQEAKDKILNG